MAAEARPAPSASAVVAANTCFRSPRQERARQRVDEADQQRADEGAADAAEAADDDDDEGRDQDLLAHADLDGEDRRRHQAGEAGQQRAEREHQRVQEPDVDAQRADDRRGGSRRRGSACRAGCGR